MIKHCAALMLALTGCATTTTTAPSASLAVTTTAPDTAGVVSRFSNDIWAAMSAYNADSSQNGPADTRLSEVIASEPSPAGTGLRNAVHDLGQNTYENAMGAKPTRDPRQGLHLATTAVTALNPPNATLHICYTYTLTDRQQPPRLQPAASDATVELHKTDTWYLRAITDDHVVPNCAMSGAD